MPRRKVRGAAEDESSQRSLRLGVKFESARDALTSTVCHAEFRDTPCSDHSQVYCLGYNVSVIRLAT